MILSPDGHCRAFDASASGTVRGNGVGIVVLKRLSNALADGDTIHAVIKASAINNDGDLKVGYTAPSVEGQAEVVAEAYARAGVEPSTVSYIETHGTGTPLGDPVEITALKQIFGEGEESQDSIAIGSVKTNIGHLNAAAGVAGLIKTVLALKHRKLPPSLHFERPNPEIDFAASPFYVNTRLAPWDENGSPLRAGVSSFGIGGTNAHAVVERAPERLASASPRDWHLLVLSARSESALQAASENLARHLQENPDLDLADVAYTLQVGRKRFGYRRTMVCQGTSDAVSVLRLAEPSRLYSTREEGAGRPVVFMFPGQGAQHVGMAAALFRSEPTFAAELARCTELLEPLIGFNLRHVLYPEEETTPEETAQRLRQTAVAQPALFATEYALAKLWMSWGIQPEAMVGHSIGELVAACLAGVFDLPDALQVVAARGRLMQELPSGSMLAVSLGEVEVAEFLGPHLSLAAVTGPKLCVLSGSSEAVAELERDLLSREVDCRRLRTSHAFHSKMMAPIVEPLHEVFAGITLRAPTIPFFSNLSGTWITDEEACSSSYWASHARGTVRLAPALQELLAAPERVLLEVGPAQTLSTLARQQLERPAGRVILSSLPHPRDRRDEVRSVFEALGRLWAAGVTIDWQGVWADEQRGRIPLPTYPFERQRFWIEPKASALGAERLGAGAPDDGMATPRPEAVPPPLRQPGENASGHGGAEDPVQRQLVELWEQLLGFAGIGVHDSFFELGGSSLLAVRLNARLEESFGVKLPPHALLESPTVAQLAEMIRESPAVDRQERPSLPSSLVELRPGHQAFPLFLVHPAGGGVYFYRELAAGLDGGQAVYGLRAQGLEEGEQSHSSIEAMAAHYIAALRTVQPDGPYFLGGSSMGGTIAFEMAQQLVGEGQNVALLALLDTPGPGQMPTKLQDDAAILDYLMGGDGPLTLEELRRYPPQDQLEVLLQRAEASNGLPADLTLATAQRLLGLFKTHMGAMREYQPLPYAGHLVFLQATERRITDPEHPERPWIELAEEGIEILRVPGNHISMHQSPHIEVLARRLESCLAAAVVKFLPGEGRRSTPGTSS